MTIRVWHVNAHSLELLATLTHHSHYVMDIALHPTSSDELVSVSLDGHMAVWDLTSECRIQDFQRCTAVIVLTPRTAFTLVRSVPLAPAGLASVAFNRTGNELIVAGDRGLLLKVHRASFRATPLAGHSNDVHHAQYFDERTILSAGADGTVRVWRESDKGTDGTQQAFTPRRGRVWKVLCHPTEPGLCAAGQSKLIPTLVTRV
jgi:WD40 repeat protein